MCVAGERNSKVLKICRQYLHHVQLSVFEGNLSPAQLLRFKRRIKDVIDPSYDEVLVYTLPPGADPVRESIGAGRPAPSNII